MISLVQASHLHTVVTCLHYHWSQYTYVHDACSKWINHNALRKRRSRCHPPVHCKDFLLCCMDSECHNRSPICMHYYARTGNCFAELPILLKDMSSSASQICCLLHWCLLLLLLSLERSRLSSIVLALHKC